MPGELKVDQPADGVRRLSISNPAKRNAPDHTIDGGLELALGCDLRIAAALREACFVSEDFREGVSAFAEKRPAVWQGR